MSYGVHKVAPNCFGQTHRQSALPNLYRLCRGTNSWEKLQKMTKALNKLSQQMSKTVVNWRIIHSLIDMISHQNIHTTKSTYILCHYFPQFIFSWPKSQVNSDLESSLLAFSWEPILTRTVFKKTGRKSGRNKHNTRFYISVPGNSLQDQSKDQQSII